MPVLLLPPAHVPVLDRRALRRVHRDDSGRDPRRRLRAPGDARRLHGRPVADPRGARFVPPADRAVPVGRQLHVRRPSGHRRQRDGPHGQRDVARRRFERDGMRGHQVRE